MNGERRRFLAVKGTQSQEPGAASLQLDTLADDLDNIRPFLDPRRNIFSGFLISHKLS
jgi:hypothetical protein